jgi:hypothetical protein
MNLRGVKKEKDDVYLERERERELRVYYHLWKSCQVVVLDM